MSETMIFQPGASAGIDTYISSGSAETNFGGQDVLQIGYTLAGKNTTLSRGLFRFDVAALGSAILESASFVLSHESTVSLTLPATFYVYRLTEPEWTELGATWWKRDGVYDWINGGGDFSTEISRAGEVVAPGQNLIINDFEALINDALANRGGLLDLIVVGLESGSQSSFMLVRSSDHANSASWPKLIVEYTVRRHDIGNFTGGMQTLTGNLGA